MLSKPRARPPASRLAARRRHDGPIGHKECPVNDLLQLAVNAHGGMERWGQISRFRAAASITGAIWALKGKPGLLDDVVLEGETRDQRLTITPFPQPGRYATWEPYRQAIETTEGVLVAEPRPRGIVRRADPPVALGRVPGRLLRGRGQLELLHGLVHPGPLRLHHRGDQALARGRPDVAQPAGSPTPTASSPTPSGRPTTSTTPGCSADSTTPSTSWAAGPRCTTRQAAASSTESWSRPAAGSTSATPTAPPVRDSLSMWTFLSDAGRKVQKDLDIKEYTDPHHDPMIPTRSCSSRAWSSTASTTATGTGAGRRSRTSAVIFAR